MDWSDPGSGTYSASKSTGFSVEVECGDAPSGGTVYVDFYWGATVVETDTDYYGTSPSYTYYPSAAGTATLKARCRDATGAFGSPNDATWRVTFS